MFQALSHVVVLAVAKACAAVANTWRSATANQAGSYRPKRTICAVPVRNGGRNTLKSPQRATLGQFYE
jgi:hypothetical protein